MPSSERISDSRCCRDCRGVLTSHRKGAPATRALRSIMPRWGSSKEELMSQAIPDKYRDLFSKRAFASMGTLMPDGTPQVTPVWCDLDGDLVIVNSAKGRQKDKNIRRDPHV